MTSVEAIAAAPFLDGLVYGEGPRWHGERLWFTDGLAGRVYSVGEAGDLAVEVELARASGLGWLPDGTLVVSTLFAAELHHVDAAGSVTASYDISDVAWSTNDLLVAPDGRIFVDLYIADGRSITGGIGLVGADGTVRVVARGLSMPNGLGILPDGSTLVVSETHGVAAVGLHRRPRRQPGQPDRLRRTRTGPASRRIVRRCRGRSLGRLLRHRGVPACDRRRRDHPPHRDRPRLGSRTCAGRSRRPNAVPRGRRHDP